MAKTSVSLPMMFGGKSTQPPSVRHNNQVETADNVVFSVRDAASKRPGAQHAATIAVVAGATATGSITLSSGGPPADGATINLHSVTFEFDDDHSTPGSAATGAITVNDTPLDTETVTLHDLAFEMDVAHPALSVTYGVVTGTYSALSEVTETITFSPAGTTYQFAGSGGTSGSGWTLERVAGTWTLSYQSGDITFTGGANAASPAGTYAGTFTVGEGTATGTLTDPPAITAGNIRVVIDDPQYTGINLLAALKANIDGLNNASTTGTWDTDHYDIVLTWGSNGTAGNSTVVDTSANIDSTAMTGGVDDTADTPAIGYGNIRVRLGTLEETGANLLAALKANIAGLNNVSTTGALDTDYVITLTWFRNGADGNSTITLSGANMSKVNMTGGVTGAGELATGTAYRLHPIDRDDVEKYLVIYGGGLLYVYNTAGVAQTVTISADAQAYLDLNSPTCDEIRMVSIADYTIIVNTTVAAGATASGFYTVTGTALNYDRLVARLGTPDAYYQTTADTATHPKGYFQYNVAAADNGFAYWTGPALSSYFDAYTDYWDNASTNPMGFKIAFQRVAMSQSSCTWAPSTKTLTKTGAFTNYTFTAGDCVNVTSGTGVVAGWYRIASKVSANAVTLETSIGASANSDTVIDGIGAQYDVTENFYEDQPGSLFDIAQRFQDKLQSLGATDALVQYDDTNSKFIIISQWRGTGATVKSISAPSTGYDLSLTSNRPFYWSGGTATAGTGTPATDTEAIADRWTRVAAPGQSSATIDASTMPVKMTRDTYGSPSTFTVSTIDWKPRQSGNDDTNPLPSIWEDGKTISDVSFHRNRLVLAGDENIVLSQDGDFFNFWIEDADEIGDSDPIDAALSSDRVTLVDFMVPFRKSMVIFTQAAQQFELNAPEVLTPSTAAITPSTRYASMVGVRPAASGVQVYFASTAAAGAQIREYVYDDTYASNIAADITSHVQGYLPTTLTTLITVPNADCVFALNRGTSYIYRYRAYWNGAEKLQSAWSRMVFDPQYVIRDIATIGTDVYMLVEVGTQFHLFRLPADQEAIPTGMTYMPLLDNWKSVTGTNSGGYTTWNYTHVDANVDCVVLGAGFGATAGTVLTATQVAGNASVKVADATGAYAGQAAYVGTRYNASMQLSRPYVRNSEGAAILDASLILHYLTLTHNNTGTYSVRVAQTGYTDEVTTYTPDAGGIDAVGETQFFVRGMADDTAVTIESTSPMPFTIVSGEYGATFQPKA